MPLVSTTAVAKLVAAELTTDLDMLATVERGGPPAFRAWTTPHHTVVVGIAVVVEEEVDQRSCIDLGIPVLRRRSGGRSVLIGPGTVQYTFALPPTLSPELGSIGGAKAFCNRLLLSALAAACPGVTLLEDSSGDLTLAGRKVAGLALKRRRRGLLVHGTILADADISLIQTVLRPPRLEPAYRQGRAHRDFLTNIGPLDAVELQTRLRAPLRRLA